MVTWWWTYAADKTSGTATLRAHPTRAEAQYEYGLMRVLGGPTRIGCSRRPCTLATVKALVVAAGFAVSRIHWPEG